MVLQFVLHVVQASESDDHAMRARGRFRHIVRVHDSAWTLQLVVLAGGQRVREANLAWQPERGQAH